MSRLFQEKARGVTVRRAAPYAVLAAALLSVLPASAEVWTSKVVGGWTYQGGGVGVPLTNRPATLASIQDDAEPGDALTATNAWSLKQPGAYPAFSNNINSRKWFAVYFTNNLPSSGISISSTEIRVDYGGTNGGWMIIHLSTNRFSTKWSTVNTSYTNRPFTNSGFIAYGNSNETSYVWTVSTYLDSIEKITNCEILVENTSNSVSDRLYYDYFEIKTVYTTLTGPKVTNDVGATLVSTNSARLNGRMIAGGPAPNVWFYCGTNDPGPTNTGWGFSNNIGPQTAGSSFSNDISGLLAGQTYYYRCFATNIYGSNWDVYPAVFTTLQASVEFGTAESSGPESSSPVVVPVVLSTTSGVPVSFDYAVVGGTASAGDFTLTNGTVTIPPGLVTTNISIVIADDAIDESNETVIVAITNTSGAVAGITTQFTYTIENDDPAPLVYFTNLPYSVLESMTNVTVAVALSRESGKPVSVDFSTSDGTATNFDDYTATNGVLTWAPGESGIKTITIAVTNDTDQENEEFFYFTLSAFSNCTLQGNSVTNVAIVDNDMGAPVIANNPPDNVTSNSASLNGSLLSTGGAPTSVWIYWGSQNGDTNKSGWATNQYMGIWPVATFGTNVTGLGRNTQYWYRCYASNIYGGAWAPETTNLLTGPPTIQFLSTATNESESVNPGHLELRLTAPSTYGLPVTVSYSATGGTASNGTDYVMPAGSITVAAGDSSTNIGFTVVDDAFDEDDETIIVGVSNVQNAVAGPNTNCTYTIMDNDSAPSVFFVGTPYIVMENGGSIVITVGLSTNTEKLASVAFATSDGTAQAGREYTATNGTFNWQRGHGVTKTFTVPIIDNGAQGGNRFFYLTLSGASNCTIAGSSLTNVLIKEDDNVPPIVTNRGASNVQWTVATLNGFMTTSYPPATAYIYWGPTDGSNNAAAWSNTIVLSSTPGLFSAPVAGLVAGGTYYFRCFATNSDEPASYDWADTTTAFTTAPPYVAGVANYYVNNEGTGGDLYCSAAGLISNSGTDVAAPNSSVQYILDTYDLNPGDVVWIDTGRYISAPVSVSAGNAGAAGSNIVLRGTTGLEGSILDINGGGDAAVSLAADYVRLENLVMTGGSYGLDANSCSGVQVVDCTTCSNSTMGIRLVSCTDPVVSNSLSFNNGVYGILLDSCTGGRLWNNDCYYNGWCGIRVSETMNPTVSMNDCHEQTWNDPDDPLGTGILVDYSSVSSTGETISSNRCYGNPYKGLDLRNGNSSLVAGNVCWSNTFEGLKLVASNLRATGNTSYANQGVGLSAGGAGVATIRNNLLFNNAGYQLDLPDTSHASLIENNTLNGGNGMHVADPYMVTNRNNIICADGSGSVALWIEALPVGSEVFASDYNNLYATEGAAVGATNAARDICQTLGEWTNSLVIDLHSISTDPQFVDISALDFHLKSPAGSYHSGIWEGDPAYSPCIDAGDPWSTFSGETLYNGMTVNQGAYGNTPEASRTVYAGSFYTVSVSNQPAQAGWAQVVWPLPSDCPTNSQYPTNRLVTISAAATNDGYAWSAWSGSVATNAQTASFLVTGTMYIVANFTSRVFSIAATAHQGGAIYPSGTVTATWGSNQVFSVSNSAGYSVSNVLVDGEWKGPTNSWTFTNITADHSIEVWFQQATSIINANAGPGGSIVPSGAVAVSWGSNQTFSITTNLGYSVSNLVVDSLVKAATNSWTFTAVTNSHTIQAWFQPVMYSITATAGFGGVISPSGTVSAAWGSDRAFAISNATGFTISNVLVDGEWKGATNGWTFANVTSNHSIEAWFRPATSIITAAAGPGGSIAPNGTVVVTWSSNQTFSITTNFGYSISNLVVDSLVKAATNSWTFTAVTNDHTIQAWFQPIPGLVITASAGPGGMITPSGEVPVAYGGDQTFNIATNLGFAVSNVVVDSLARGATNSWTFVNVTNNGHVIEAWFQPVMYSITATAGFGGVISPSGTVSAAWGSDRAFAISNATGFTISNVLVDGEWKGATNGWTFANVTSNHSIEAWFRPATSLITAAAGPGGSIAPSGLVVVVWSSNQAFTITTNLGFAVSNVAVDDILMGATNDWVFQGVTNNHTIQVWFSALSEFTSNGTPHAWLQLHGYTNNYDDADWSDEDKDRSFAWQEYQAGTVPTNDRSVFRVLRADFKTTSNLVSWYATTNSGVYALMSIYRSTNLRYGTWVSWASNISRSASGTNNWWDTNLPAAGIPAFYRPCLTNQGH